MIKFNKFIYSIINYSFSYILSCILILSNFNIILANTQDSFSQDSTSLNITAKSAVIMEASTGTILYGLNQDESLSPASVTKVMTIFLIYEAVANNRISWDDVVTISEYASSMGGSQIFLETGEQQTVRDLTKSIVIASANDAAVAMAEFIAGTEGEFVNLMNEKANLLGMIGSNFENACGLDTDTVNHYMSAQDIAIISRELILNYPDVYEFTQTWQDTITHTTKSGSTQFGLTNTNKLLKLYDNATGLKTGSTQKALYCLSGTAEKDGLSLIAVIMGASDPNIRFQEVISMFEYGFDNFELVQCAKQGNIVAKSGVYKGKVELVEAIIQNNLYTVIKKIDGKNNQIQEKIELLEGVTAPIEKDSKLGEIIYIDTSSGNEIGRVDLIAKESVDKANLSDIFKKLIVDWVA